MGATYTRQSSYSDGDTITAAHTNDEFNQLLAAFAVSTGHTHDGTAAEGGPITKLLGNTLTFGAGTAGTDITITFDGETTDGVLKWMEDEDYFEFSDDILIATNEKLQFRDTGLYISSNADGDLDIVSDGTAVDSINIESAGGITLDAGTAANGIIYEDDGTEMARLYNSSSDVILETKVSDKDFLIKGNDGGSVITAMTIDMSEAGAVTFNDKITAVGTSVFTNLDISGDVDIDGTTNLDAVDIDGAVQIDSTVTVGVDDTGYDVKFFGDTASAYMQWDASADDLILGGAAGLVVPDGQLTLGSTAVGATAAELNLLDGSAKSTSSITIADADAFLIIDGTTTKQIPASDLVTYVSASVGDITGVTAGVGLSGGGTSGALTLTLDLSELSDVTPANGDKLATLDSDGANEQLTTIASLATLFAGTGLSASSSVMSIDAAQTGITSLLATDIKIGEDDQTKIDFETADEIHFYAANVEQVYLADNIFGPQSDSDVDLGSSSVRWKDAYVDSITVTGNADIDGDVDVDGTLEADAITVGGTALNTVIAGVTVTNATTAAVATTVTISDNESTNEDNAIIFTAGGDVDGGNIGLESDGDLTYNPSTGRLTATQLSGTLQTAAQPNITSVGTLGDITAKTSDGAILKLQTSHTTVADGDVLGAIEFSAPDEADGADGDARLLAASIVAEADDTFSDTNNETDLVFKLGDSEAAIEVMRLKYDSELILTSDSGTSTSNPQLTLYRNSSSPADGDELGKISFKGEDDGDGLVEYAYVQVEADDVSNGSPDASFKFISRVNGSNVTGLSLTGNLATFNSSIVIGDAGNIGSASDTDAIAIASNGVVTLSQGLTSTAASNTLGATSFNDANITNVGDIALDSITSDGGNAAAITFSQGVVPNTVTEAASGNYTPDMSRYTNFILTVDNSNNCTLQDPTDEVAGQSGIFVFIQDGTGGGTLSHADDRYFVSGGTSITLSTAANAIDIVPYFVQADGKIHLGAAQKAFAEA